MFEYRSDELCCEHVPLARIATAVGTPTVSLFGPTDPERNGPFDPRDIAVSRYDSCGCHYDRTCHQDPWCLAGVTVAEVCAAVKRRLANG